MKVANDISLSFTILIVFPDFIRVHRTEISMYEHTTEFVTETKPAQLKKALRPTSDAVLHMSRIEC